MLHEHAHSSHAQGSYCWLVPGSEALFGPWGAQFLSRAYDTDAGELEDK